MLSSNLFLDVYNTQDKYQGLIETRSTSTAEVRVKTSDGKTKILSQLLSDIKNRTIIITTWEPNDLLSGASELELYTFCKQNNFFLYFVYLKITDRFSADKDAERFLNCWTSKHRSVLNLIGQGKIFCVCKP